MITLVLGGARSGKSEVAEIMAARSHPPVTYVATGWACDDEMVERIASHRARRPPGWDTVETGKAADLAEALARVDGTALVDSLGTWVAGNEDFEVDADGLCKVLRCRAGDTILVSDEVGLGVHPSSSAGLRFRDALGALNQKVAAASDLAVLVVAGRVIPLGDP